jgi:hypothetical protein
MIYVFSDVVLKLYDHTSNPQKLNEIPAHPFRLVALIVPRESPQGLPHEELFEILSLRLSRQAEPIDKGLQFLDLFLNFKRRRFINLQHSHRERQKRLVECPQTPDPHEFFQYIDGEPGLQIDRLT